MADNYLDKKLEEYKNRSVSAFIARKHFSLNSLLIKNSILGGYDTSFVVRDDQLRSIIEVNTKVFSMCKRKSLRFRPVNYNEVSKILPYIRIETGLYREALPLSSTELNAFIVICSSLPESKNVYVDLGISVQSMLLRAVELGLVGFLIENIDKDIIKKELELKYDPLMVVAIGRRVEKMKFMNARDGNNLDSYAKDDISYDVSMKLSLDDLIIK